ncbi:MAG: precorrin-2 C(20)-methyltransferase [Proteobacteria bacterium]|nr:precorrin-2 C(20)-methyltransferase [Pseudomonadota bacterium]
MSDASRETPPETPRGTVIGIGVGPGDPELITLKGARILSRAAVVAYPAPETGDSLARAIAAPHLRPGATEIAIRMPLSSNRFPVEAVYDRAAAEIATYLAQGQDVAVLCEGDPFFYGSFMYVFARLAEDWPVEVVPGVSSLTACAAVTGTALAALTDVLTILPGPLPDDVLRARLGETDAAAIIKVGRHLPRIRALLDEMGLTDRAQYVERATMDRQVVSPLEAVSEAAAPYFSMILIHKRGVAWS